MPLDNIRLVYLGRIKALTDGTFTDLHAIAARQANKNS